MALYFWQRPTTLFDQHFGLGIDPEDILMDWSDLLTPSSRNYNRLWRCPTRNTLRRDVGSKISQNKDSFQVCLDVQQFAPEEISVKTVGNQVLIEGKHEEKQDEHGYISRHFVRKYQLPEGCQVENVASSLSSDGVLTITAPKKRPESIESGRNIPISITGPVHKTLKNNDTDSKPAKEDAEMKS